MKDLEKTICLRVAFLRVPGLALRHDFGEPWIIVCFKGQNREGHSQNSLRSRTMRSRNFDEVRIVYRRNSNIRV